MFDNEKLQQFIQQQLETRLQGVIDSLITDETWLSDIETRVILRTQQSLTDRFQDVSEIPGIVNTVMTSVKTIIASGELPELRSYINQDVINASVTKGVTDIVTKAVDNLIVDPAWIDQVQRSVDQHMMDRVVQQLSHVDINTAISNHVEQSFERWKTRLRQDTIGDAISLETQTNELCLVEGAVVARSSLVTPQVQVTDLMEVQGTARVQNLVVLGNINTDNHCWNELAEAIGQKASASLTESWKQQLVMSVRDLISEQGIDFHDVTIGGENLVEDRRLSSGIVDSNLETLGKLKNLEVLGHAKIADTVNVLNHRVGINTDQPEMALTVWDEEVGVMAGKLAQNTAYIGTNRRHGLVLGINRQPVIDIDVDGLVTMKSLRLDRFRVGHATDVPGWSGTRGDLMLNSDPKPDQPFAWVCLGAYRWQPLRSA